MTYRQTVKTPIDARRKSRRVAGWLGVALCGVLAAASSAQAELFLYEGFDYEPGLLSENDGGIGFDGWWEQRGADPEVWPDSLEFTDAMGHVLVTSGNHVDFTLDRTNAWRPLDPTKAPAEWVNDEGKLGKDGTSIWLSFVYESLIEDTGWGGISLGDGDVVRGQNRIDIGQKRSPVFSMGFPGAPDPTHVESDIPLDERSLVVVRLDFFELTDPDTGEGEDELRMWISPLLDEVPQDSDALFLPFRMPDYHDEQDPTWQFDFMRITGPGDTVLDELRMGTTYADVTPIVGAGAAQLQAGDADQDLDFDQMDLVLVQIAAKYLTGQAATWGEGDWNGAPGGEKGNPPAGDGQFNQLDVIEALAPGHYLTGPYAALTVSTPAESGLTGVGPLASVGAGNEIDLAYIPEPASIVLLGLGMVLATLCRGRLGSQ